MSDHEWCQPAETRVETPGGPVPIGSLRDGDRVVSYSRPHNALVGLREGLAVRRTARPYRGPMLNVRVGSELNRMKTSIATHLPVGETVEIIGEEDEYWKIEPPAGVVLYINKASVDVGR